MKTMRCGRRILAAVLCAFTLLVLLPVTSAHAETALATGFVNTATLNVRSEPSVHGSIVVTIKKNAAVNIYEVCGTWLRIDIPAEGKSGYVSGKYITINSTSLTAYGLGTTAKAVNLRSKATSKSDRLATLEVNTGFTILSVAANGWYQVRVHGSGQEGYIGKNYVKVVAKVANASASGNASATTGVINAGGVNLRSGPSTKDKSLGLLVKNTSVRVVSVSGEWTKVEVTASGKTGYVFSKFVTAKVAVGKPTPAATQAGKSAYITGEGVNLRTGPSTSNGTIDKLSKNTPVSVLNASGRWYQVKVTSTGKTGYVHNAFVRIGTAPTAAPTVTPTPNAATPTPTAGA